MSELQELTQELRGWQTDDLARLIRESNEGTLPLLVKAARNVLASRVQVVIEPKTFPPASLDDLFVTLPA